MQKFLRLLIVPAMAMFGSSALASPLTTVIDDFESGGFQSVSSADLGPNVVVAPTAVGGSRSLEVLGAPAVAEVLAPSPADEVLDFAGFGEDGPRTARLVYDAFGNSVTKSRTCGHMQHACACLHGSCACVI